jgi:class 3 adenylate cyclase
MSRSVQRRLAAIVSADVAGYSRLVGRDEERALARLGALRREVIDPAVVSHRGRIVKTLGDGLLIEFASVVDAVRCAVVVQRGVASHNSDVPTESRIEFRIGINVGDVVVEGDDLLGDGVNVAVRVEGLAEPRGICLSDAAYQHVRDKLEHTFVDCGEQKLKNIERPVRIYRISLDGTQAFAASHGPPSRPPEMSPIRPSAPFRSAAAREGEARFRRRGEPIGLSGNGRQVRLEQGPALWLRLMPSGDVGKTWQAIELKELATRQGGHLVPLGGEGYGGDFRPVMAEDGFGLYALLGNEQIAKAVVFAFATGELWAVEAGRIEAARAIPYCERHFVNALASYARFLQARLELPGPYRWIAGVEGAKGRPIELPRTGARGLCLADVIQEEGLHEVGRAPEIELRPFFLKLHARCQIERPSSMDDLLLEAGR